MDTTTLRLVEYAQAFYEAKLSATARKASAERLFDSIAVAIAGSGSEPAIALARVARSISADKSGTVFGYGIKTSPDLAALVNSIMVRTYDYNDALADNHPSDMIPGILAAGEIGHSSGMDVLTGIALAYEILGGLAFEIELGKIGLDQGTFMGVAVALAAGCLWGLDQAQLANAVSLALVPNLPLSVSRWGSLSMMKGCATAFAVRNGIFSALLCHEGFTSAPEPFEGIFGLRHITGDFNPRLPVNQEVCVVEMGNMKAWPAEGNVQGLLDLVPRIRAWAQVDEMDSIDVTVGEDLVMHLADEPKYDPKTRETADHSLPYMLMVALVDGTITLDSYTPERIADPALRPLMRKIHVHGSRDYTEARRTRTQVRGISPPKPTRITINTSDGRVFDEEFTNHKGHSTNPLTPEDLNRKFDTICASVPTISEDQREHIRQKWWRVESAPDINDVISSVVGFRSLTA